MKQKRAWKLGVAIALGSLVVSGSTMAVVSCSQGSTTPSKPEPTPIELFEFDPKTQTITKYNGGPTQCLTIPNEIDGLPVKKIAPRVFYGTGAFAVQLPNQLEEIGDYAFCGNYLFELTIPASVKRIGDRAFLLNSWLQRVTFEEGNLEEIDAYAFNSCKGLLSIQLPDSLANPEAKPLGIGSFWSEQGTYNGVPKKVSMREGTKLAGSRFDVFTANSEIYTRTGTNTTVDPNLPTKFNSKQFQQVVNEITHITNYNNFDADDMAYAINNYSNAEIVSAINANQNEMFNNAGANLMIADIAVSAEVNKQNVNVIIDGVPLSNGRIGQYTVTFKGFTRNAPIPSGYQYDRWNIGDRFLKNGFMYQVIRNPKRTYWPNQPKYALELVDADTNTCKLDHLADDNSGRVSFNDTIKGNLSLDVLVIGRHSISKGSQNGCTIGDGQNIRIRIPDSVYNIEHESFANITNKVDELYLGNRLEVIDAYVFCRMHYSGTLNIPKTVTYIAEGAFSDSDFTGTVVLPPKLKVLPSACFSWCRRINEVILNDGLERIDIWAMYAMDGVDHDINIPDSVQYIASSTFGGCFGHKITVSYPAHLNLSSGQIDNYGQGFKWNFVPRS